HRLPGCGRPSPPEGEVGNAKRCREGGRAAAAAGITRRPHPPPYPPPQGGRGFGWGSMRQSESTTAGVTPKNGDRVGPRTWLGFLAMCLGMFRAILDIQIVASSLPQIQAAVGIPSHQL